MCDHKRANAQVEVSFLEDLGRYSADVRVWCDDCHAPFAFLSLPQGLDLDAATVSVDGTEARLPIHPVGETPPIFTGVRGYTITLNRVHE